MICQSTQNTPRYACLPLTRSFISLFLPQMTVRSCRMIWKDWRNGKKIGKWSFILQNAMFCPSQGRKTGSLSHILYTDVSLRRLPQPSTWVSPWRTTWRGMNTLERQASRANKKLGFLRRNIKTRDQSLKEKAYKTIVRPTMEYCSTVWDPYYETHSNTLEKVHRRPARWVTGRFHNMSSPSTMIQELGWWDLNQHRADSRLCMLYKISQGLVDIPIRLYLKYSRDGVHFQTIYARTKYYEFSFFPRTVAAWN